MKLSNGFSCYGAVLGLMLGASACSSDTSGNDASEVRDTIASAAIACRETVDTFTELLIVNPAVVGDPALTSNGDVLNNVPAGKWSFRHLVEQIAPSPEQAPELVLQWLNEWKTRTDVAGHPIAPREQIDNIINAWPKLNGRLVLSKAPFKLLAIVNRMDLRSPTKPSGEGRFVFVVTTQPQNPGEIAQPRQFTVIFEYNLPTTATMTTEQWAAAWHGLQKKRPASLKSALVALTDKFTARGSAPGAVNGSAISQIRSNEIDLASPWELREFHLDPSTGFLSSALVGNTPDLTLNANHFLFQPEQPGIATLASFANDPANREAILQQRHDLSAVSTVLGAFSHSDEIPWAFQDVADEEVRHALARQTCSGCHNVEPVDSARGIMNIDGFYHIAPRASTGDGTNIVSEFMKQVDLPARAEHLRSILCSGGRIAEATPNGRVH